MIRSLKGIKPDIEKATFIAPSADIIGDVRLGKGVSVWYCCVLRGDVMPIEVGDESNIQDGTVIHGTYKKAAAKIGRRVTVGHNVVLHGCDIGDRCLIGMGSVIMDGAKIPPDCVVGAGSLVTEGSEFESGWLIMGQPAKAKRPLKPEELKFLNQSADNYLEYQSWYFDGGEESNEKQ